MKAGIKFILAALLLAACMPGCKPDYVIPESKMPELKPGQVLWLDLNKFNSISTSDAVAIKNLWENIHLAVTLQGIVNRDEPLMYLDYIRMSGKDLDQYWWDMYAAPGEWLAGKEKVVIYDPVKACELFRDKINGLVVYDPNVAATSCLASTIAGVEDLVAVRYDTTPGSLYNRLVTHGFKPKVWLVNEDGSSKFTGKTDAYRWIIDNYLKTGKCSTDYAAYYLDQYWMKVPGNAVANHHQLTNHDFFVSHRSFFFDLSPWEDERATDDPDGEIGADCRTLKEILLEIYHHNGEGNTFCHIGGFPAWPYKYTDHGNVGGSHPPTATEWKFAEIIGEYNAFHDADAASLGAMANASFWQHFPLRASYPQKWVTRAELKAKGYLKADGTVDRSKRYVLLYVGDYDAASWIYQTTTDIWDDPNRGKVPMMWSVSPVLERRAPQAMHYMWTSATDNDYFAAADNGAGYLNPGSLEEPRQISGLADGMQQWAAHCKPLYERWGITVTGFIIDGNAKGMTNAGFKAYATFSPNGIVPQRTPALGSLVDGMPVMRAGGSAGSDVTQDAADIIVNTTKDHTYFPFYWFRAVLKTPSWYVQVKSLLDKKDPNIVWMSGPEFFELMRCYLEEE